MKLQNRSAAPDDSAKALLNPASTPGKYQAEITDTARFWGEQAARAGAMGSGALLSMSQSILGALSLSLTTWNKLVRDPSAPDRDDGMEFSRKMALSTVAVSTLLRHYWEYRVSEQEQIEFIDEKCPHGTVLDMVATKPWEDFRVHTAITAESTPPEGPAEQWYREGDLWVRHARSAEPTRYLERVFLPQIGVQLNFSQYETLVPHMQAR
jgi:hypothetical protein